jgi:hypothetical protein
VGRARSHRSSVPHREVPNDLTDPPGDAIARRPTTPIETQTFADRPVIQAKSVVLTGQVLTLTISGTGAGRAWRGPVTTGQSPGPDASICW